MNKIVFLDRQTIGASVKLNTPHNQHEWIAYENTIAEQIVERLQNADIAIINKVPLRADVLVQLPQLKMIAVAATGYDNVDIETCLKQGIVVSNVRGYALHTVPEHTFALIFALRRRLMHYRQDVINGEWQKDGRVSFFKYPIKDLHGQRLGIIGEGVIGQEVARIGQALGMDTVFAAHKGVQGLGPLYTPWQEVLETSDIITIHSPLISATRNMIATPEFEMMKKKPLLINTARGGLVEETALVNALKQGLIAGIGFDVLTTEPPQDDNPLLTILDDRNVIVTPHVAWASDEAMQTLWDQVIEHIDNFIEGKPSNQVIEITEFEGCSKTSPALLVRRESFPS